MGHTPIVETMTMREALLGVLNEDLAELFARAVALEVSGFPSLVIATEEEAIAGVDNTKAMTPLRTHQAIAANPGGYLRPADHTKAIHDSLGIDADTLDGLHASEILAFADHTKALHDALGIDADTLDGYHGTGIRAKNESIYLSQGQVIRFSETVEDKIRLRGTQYGIAVNTDELTLYAPSDSEIAVRDSSYNGQKLGDVIHTGNSTEKGVAMTLSRRVSTSGDHVIKVFNANVGLYPSYYMITTLSVPWLGVTNYWFKVYVYSGEGNTLYVKLNDTEYGPYPLPMSSFVYVSIDHAERGPIDIRCKIESGSAVAFKSAMVRTGNAEIPHRAVASYIDSRLKTA